MTNRLPIPWVRHLKDQDSKDNFERSVRASVLALSRLYDILEEKEEVLLYKDATEEDFVQTDWAFKQAFRNGQKAQIKELKQLLSFTQPDKG